MKAALKNTHYYRVMNHVFQRALGAYHVAHYPYFGKEGENLLEVGCGNGEQSMYIKEHHNPPLRMGLDLQEDNAAVANAQCPEKTLQGIQFIQSDAQDMVGVESNSFDHVINVESCLHHPARA